MAGVQYQVQHRVLPQNRLIIIESVFCASDQPVIDGSLPLVKFQALSASGSGFRSMDNLLFNCSRRETSVVKLEAISWNFWEPVLCATHAIPDFEHTERKDFGPVTY
jgi:hypothetical protein